MVPSFFAVKDDNVYRVQVELYLKKHNEQARFQAVWQGNGLCC